MKLPTCTYIQCISEGGPFECMYLLFVIRRLLNFNIGLVFTSVSFGVLCFCMPCGELWLFPNEVAMLVLVNFKGEVIRIPTSPAVLESV